MHLLAVSVLGISKANLTISLIFLYIPVISVLPSSVVIFFYGGLLVVYQASLAGEGIISQEIYAGDVNA